MLTFCSSQRSGFPITKSGRVEKAHLTLCIMIIFFILAGTLYSLSVFLSHKNPCTSLQYSGTSRGSRGLKEIAHVPLQKQPCTPYLFCLFWLEAKGKTPPPQLISSLLCSFCLSCLQICSQLPRFPYLTLM